MSSCSTILQEMVRDLKHNPWKFFWREYRIRGEEDAKQAKVAAEDEARRAAERAARDAEEARIRSEEERRRAEEQRAREEAARLEAIRVAEVEKARMGAEQQARMEAMNAQQQHALQIEALKRDKGKKQLRNILIGTIAAVMAIGGVVTYLVIDSSNKAKAREEALQQENRKKEEELSQLKKKAEEANSLVANLESAVANEKDQRKKAELQNQLDTAKAEADAANEKAGVKGTPGRLPTKAGDDTPKAKTICTCKSTDPLCDCL
jgi:colicin import membrane protein